MALYFGMSFRVAFDEILRFQSAHIQYVYYQVDKPKRRENRKQANDKYTTQEEDNEDNENEK